MTTRRPGASRSCPGDGGPRVGGAQPHRDIGRGPRSPDRDPAIPHTADTAPNSPYAARFGDQSLDRFGEVVVTASPSSSPEHVRAVRYGHYSDGHDACVDRVEDSAPPAPGRPRTREFVA